MSKKILLICLIGLGWPLAAQAEWVTATVTAGDMPHAVAINPVTNKIYLANYTSGTVTVIDGATNGTTTVAAGTNPYSLAVNPATNKIYVTNSGSNNVTVIDGATLGTVTVAAGAQPQAIAVSTATGKIYVANNGGSSVTVINGADNSTDSVITGSGPYDLAVNPTTNKIYVANYNSNDVTVIDGATNGTTTVTAGTGPIAVAVNPAANKIYVANNTPAGQGSVTVINGADNSVVATVPVEYFPQHIAANPVTGLVYVINNNSGHGTGTATVINGAADTVVATVSVGAYASGLSVNPLTNRIYVTAENSNNVTIINGNTSSAIGTVGTGTDPRDIAANPVTNKIYVVNRQSDNMTVIDGSEYNTIAVAAGSYPEGVAVNPITNKIYVANTQSHNVTVIDGATNGTVTVAAGTNARNLAVNPVTNNIYVTNPGSNDVTIIDGVTNGTATVTAGTSPFGVAVNTANNMIYVTNDGSNNLSVIDGTTGSLVKTVTVGTTPRPVVVNPSTNKIYVLNAGSNSVTVIDGITYDTTTVPVGDAPVNLAVNPVTNKIYVSNGNSNNVTVIDGATNGTTTVAAGTRPTVVAVNPVTNKIYVLNENSANVTIIDGATNGTTTVAAGTWPSGLVVNPLTNNIYVGNGGSDNVTVIDGISNSTTSVGVGDYPHRLALNPVTNKVYAVNLDGGNVTVISHTPVYNSKLRVEIDTPGSHVVFSGRPVLTGKSVNRWAPNRTSIMGTIGLWSTGQQAWSWANTTFGMGTDSTRWQYFWGSDSLLPGENYICITPLEQQAATANNLGVGTPLAGNMLVYPVYRTQTQLPAPALAFPPNNSIINYFPELAWHPSAGADTYRVEFGTVSPYQALGGSGWLSDTAYQFPAYWDSVYYWKVKAFKSGWTDSSGWSQEWNFRVDRQVPSIIATAPSNNQIHVGMRDTIRIRFSEPMRLSGFRFYCSPDPGGWSFTWAADDSLLKLAHAPFALGTSYSFVMDTVFDKAGNLMPPGGPYNPLNFTTRFDTTRPELVYAWPADGDTDVPVNAPIKAGFSEPIETGSFNINISPNPNGWAFNWNSRCDTVTMTHNDYPASTSCWIWISTVRDTSENRLLTDSLPIPNPWTFTTSGLAIACPNLIAPTNGALLNVHTPNMIWSKINNASYYRLQIGGDTSFTNLYVNQPTGTNDDTTYSAAYFNDSLYYWRVKSCTAGDSSIWSPVNSFRIDTQAPGAPTNVTVNGGNPSPWTNNQNFSIDLTDPPDSSGIARYLFKLGAAPANPTDTNGASTVKPFIVQAPGQGSQLLYVWCQDNAGNIAGIGSTATATMRWDTTRPTGCVAGSPSVSQTVSFNVSWTIGTDNIGSLSGRYDVKVKDGGGAWQDWLIDTAALSAGYTGANGHRYYFVAMNKDSAGNVEIFNNAAECSTFVDTAQLSTPSLAAPPDSQFTNNLRPTFAWHPVAGTDTFELNYSMNQDMSSPVSKMVYNDTVYAITADLTSNARYYWQVRAIKPDGSDTSSWSSSWTFYEDQALPAAPAGTSANPGAWTNNPNFAITFAQPADSSGIGRYFYKLDEYANRPQSNDDTTGSFPNAPYGLIAAKYTVNPLYFYVWARDGAGNLSYLNRDSVRIYYDPVAPESTRAESRPVSTTDTFTVSWQNKPGTDAQNGNPSSGLSGKYWIKCKINAGLWQDLDTNYTGAARLYTGSNLNKYFFEVGARDIAGNVETFSGAPECSTYVDTSDLEPPRLYTKIADTARMWAGQTFTMRVFAADNRGISEVRLSYARAGDPTSGTMVLMNHISDSSYIYDIPGSGSMYNGIQYRVTAMDIAGNSTAYPSATSFYVHKTWYSSPVGFNSASYDRWQMVSFPLDLAGQTMAVQLGDDLGNYDNTKWRLFEYRNNAYGEITNMGFGFTFGRAYWLKQRIADPLYLDFSSVSTFTPGTSDSTARIMLQNGWNDFGLPYQFGVNWADIKQATGADTNYFLSARPYTYNGATWVYPAADPLAAWKGYSIKIGAANATLKIRPRADSKDGIAKQNGLWPNGWVAKVSVSAANGLDECNYFGIGAGTSQAVDIFDYPEPPAFFSGVYGAFSVPQTVGEYGSDLRPSLGQGQTWDFAVTDAAGTAAITFSLPPDFPAGAACYLCDLADIRTWKVVNDYAYQYQPESGETKRNFKLIAGSEEYAQAELKKTFTAPATTLLGQNRPNPFAQATILHYQLAAPGPVSVMIYNVAGQKVRTLVSRNHEPGRYSVRWDARDGAGAPLANGVYIARLTAGEVRMSRRLVLLK